MRHNTLISKHQQRFDYGQRASTASAPGFSLASGVSAFRRHAPRSHTRCCRPEQCAKEQVRLSLCNRLCSSMLTPDEHRRPRERCEGLPYRTIQNRLDTTAPTISRWKNRFLTQRVAGLLEIRHPGQKPSVITPALQAKVLEATRRKPRDGSTDWSCRKLAGQLGISKDTVQRIWRKAGLKPHRLERHCQLEGLGIFVTWNAGFLGGLRPRKR
jgi:transposase